MSVTLTTSMVSHKEVIGDEPERQHHRNLDASNHLAEHQKANCTSRVLWSCIYCLDQKIITSEPDLYKHAKIDHPGLLPQKDEALGAWRDFFANASLYTERTSDDASSQMKEHLPSSTVTCEKNVRPGNNSHEWPNPELSIGSKCKSLDRLGRYKCWTIRETSPAHLVWKVTVKPMTKILEDQFEHLETRGSDIIFEMYMIGRNPSKSRPTIVFSCPEKLSRKIAIKMIEKSGLLADYPGVMLADCSRQPRALALGSSSEMIRLEPGVYTTEDMTSFGFSILIASTDLDKPRRATMGGFLSINDTIYGFTAAHAFLEPEADHLDEDEDFDFEIHGSEEPDGIPSEDEQPANTHLSISCGQTDAFVGSFSSDPGHTLGQKENISHQKETAEDFESPSTPTGNSISKLGRLYETPSEATRKHLDWALVEIDIDHIPSHGAQDNQSETTTKRKNLFRNGEQSVESILSNDLQQYNFKGTVVSEPLDTDILALCGSSNMPLEGRLSAMPSFIKYSGSTGFQELWRVTLEAGNSFEDGDCGSWIIDRSNGYLYGHLVSGYPVSGIGYIVPAFLTLEDIQWTLGANVQLSSSALLDNFRARIERQKGSSRNFLQTRPRPEKDSDLNPVYMNMEQPPPELTSEIQSEDIAGSLSTGLLYNLDINTDTLLSGKCGVLPVVLPPDTIYSEQMNIPKDTSSHNAMPQTSEITPLSSAFVRYRHDTGGMIPKDSSEFVAGASKNAVANSNNQTSKATELAYPLIWNMVDTTYPIYLGQTNPRFMSTGQIKIPDNLNGQAFIKQASPTNSMIWSDDTLSFTTQSSAEITLPCEFTFIGCEIEFSLNELESWILHSESHFAPHGPPKKAICTFCDDDTAVFENAADPTCNWRARMMHISDHFTKPGGTELARPDFWVLDYMRSIHHMSEEDYNHAILYDERPPLEDVYPLGYQPQEATERKYRQSQIPHDLEREEREMRRAKKKKGKSTHGRSRRNDGKLHIESGYEVVLALDNKDNDRQEGKGKDKST